MGESSMDLTDIDYLGIDRVFKRGTGKVIERHDWKPAEKWKYGAARGEL